MFGNLACLPPKAAIRIIRRAFSERLLSPRTTAKRRAPEKQVVVRLHNPLLAAIDAWRSGQDGEPTRAEALRRLAARGLATDNEKLARTGP